MAVDPVIRLKPESSFHNARSELHGICVADQGPLQSRPQSSGVLSSRSGIRNRQSPCFRRARSVQEGWRQLHLRHRLLRRLLLRRRCDCGVRRSEGQLRGSAAPNADVLQDQRTLHDGRRLLPTRARPNRQLLHCRLLCGAAWPRLSARAPALPHHSPLQGSAARHRPIATGELQPLPRHSRESAAKEAHLAVFGDYENVALGAKEVAHAASKFD